MDYNFNKLEKKWQAYWKENETYKVSEDASMEKYYVLDMFPYPSGAGLHVGHPLGYIASDVYARYKKLKGFNVLHPMGYDSFGLPTEQYAIQTGIHPAVATKDNTERYRKQLAQIGFSYDWLYNEKEKERIQELLPGVYIGWKDLCPTIPYQKQCRHCGQMCGEDTSPRTWECPEFLQNLEE